MTLGVDLGLARVGRSSPGAPTLVRCALSRSTRRPPRRVVVAQSCPTRVRYPGAAGGTSAGGIAPSSSRHQIRLPGFNQPSRSTRCEDVARLHFACSGPAYASVPSTCPRSHPARGSINSPQRAHTTPPASTWRATESSTHDASARTSGNATDPPAPSSDAPNRTDSGSTSAESTARSPVQRTSGRRSPNASTIGERNLRAGVAVSLPPKNAGSVRVVVVIGS